MSSSEDRRSSRSRTQLILIWVLFLLPPISAWVAWKYLGEQGAGATTNAGTLVAPARPLQLHGLRQPDGKPLAEGDLRGRWTYVLFASADCGDRCQKQLYLTRQIRIAMSKDIQRVQRVLVLSKIPSPALVEQLAAEHEDLRWVVGGEQAKPLLQQFSGEGFDPTGAQFFLIDPLGNLMMYYDLEVAAKGMMRDLQKLLKISQIG